MNKTTKNTWTIYVPVDLKKDIEALNLSSSRTYDLLKLIGILKRNSQRSLGKGNFTGTSTLSKVFFRQVFDSRYLDFLNPAVEAGIIVRNNSYSIRNKQAKKYSLSEKYYLVKYEVIIDYNIINYNNVTSNIIYPLFFHNCGPLLGPGDSETPSTTRIRRLGEDVQKIRYSPMKYFDKSTTSREEREIKTLTNKFKKDMNVLTINQNKMVSKVIDRASKISTRDLKLNEEITRDIIGVYNGEELVYLSLNYYISSSRLNGLSVIQYKNKFFIDDPEEFINRKKVEIVESAFESIANLGENSLRASRNTTNSRLDTNLTNISSIIVDVLKEDNDLVELDMVNSQFAIFSYILESEKIIGADVDLFKELSYAGELYSYIQKMLGLITRSEAKQVMFEVTFGEGKHKSNSYKEFSEVFPTVIKWIEDYKKEYGYKAFSIMLQKTESEIFIDNIYYGLKSLRTEPTAKYPKGQLRNILVLTKHDSIIVRREDFDEVRKYISDYFNAIGFKGRLK